MKKFLAMLACIIMALSLVACGNGAVEERFCDDLAQAEKIIGFKLEAPETLNDSGSRNFRVCGRTLEIMYFSGKVMNGKISKSDNQENIGAYDYGYTESVIISDGGIEYKLCGSENGEKVHLATWTKGKYSYFVLDGNGKSAEEMLDFCKEIN